MLETVVPKTIESIIMIVKGQYKGQVTQRLIRFPQKKFPAEGFFSPGAGTRFPGTGNS